MPIDTPGVTVMRDLPVFGYDDQEGHAEIDFDDVRVPASNLIAGEGDGFMIAQARLGPGRIHHCMRAIGAAERALEAMCARAVSRVTFGQPLATRANIQDWIAESRIEIEMARLLTLKAAWLMDTVGNRQARTEIAAIKVAAPNVALKVLDRAIQVHGGGGVSDDFRLATAYAHLRTLRLADGPDEVHKLSIARRELAPYMPREASPPARRPALRGLRGASASRCPRRRAALAVAGGGARAGGRRSAGARRPASAGPCGRAELTFGVAVRASSGTVTDWRAGPSGAGARRWRSRATPTRTARYVDRRAHATHATGGTLHASTRCARTATRACASCLDGRRRDGASADRSEP